MQPDTKLGNIMDCDWPELLDSPLYERFGRRKSDMHSSCRSCPYLSLCAGDCLKHRPGNLAEPRSLSALCDGWRQFYAHALPELRSIAERVRQMRRRAAPPLPAGPGRNDPCPCGSGRKYKACCGA